MTKAELVESVAHVTWATQVDTRVVLDVTFSRIALALERGQSFRWPGFGTFSVRRRKARLILNPVTKQPMRLPSSKTVGFRAAKELKVRL